LPAEGQEVKEPVEVGERSRRQDSYGIPSNVVVAPFLILYALPGVQLPKIREPLEVDVIQYQSTAVARSKSQPVGFRRIEQSPGLERRFDQKMIKDPPTAKTAASPLRKTAWAMDSQRRDPMPIESIITRCVLQKTITLEIATTEPKTPKALHHH